MTPAARWLEELVLDARYALRSLRGAPAFTTAAILTLAIGIGANTAIFSALDGVLFKPLPFTAPDRVVTLYQNDRKRGIDRDDVAPGNFADWRERSRAFAAMAAAEPFGLVYTTRDGQELVGNWNVTRDFFAVLDARPILGRLLLPDDFQPGRSRVVVLTYDSWQRRFGGDASVVGSSITLQNAPATIVGVLPRNFSYLGNLKRYELFTPKVLDSIEVNLRASAWYHAVARLAAGVTPQQAAADLARVSAQLEQEYPKTNAGISVTMLPLRDGIVGGARPTLWLLLGSVGFVLLIACANVANLMLARTARRGQEFAVRVALGAGPRRIARQLLTESFVIALLGGAAGTALAYWGVGAIRALSPDTLPRVEEMRVDARALAFALATVTLTAVLFGLLPALRAAARRTGDEIRSGVRSAGSHAQRRVRGWLVSLEIALAVVLLVGAGLLMRSFVSVTSQPLGYQRDHVLAATVFVWQWNRTPAARRDFVARLVDRSTELPGVLAAGATTSLPLAGAIGADQAPFTVVGRPVNPGEEPTAHVTALTPGAFAALRMPLRRGRVFTARDDSASVPVAVLSESMARRYWPTEDPIGQYVRLGFYAAPRTWQIVGIVADVRHDALDAPVEPTVYLPHAQAPTGAVTVLLRTGLVPRMLERDFRRLVAELNPQLPVSSVTTIDDVVSDSLRPRRFALVLLACFAVSALLLAVVGVYGVMSNATAERSREFGVRMALGAQSLDVITMVMGQGMRSALAGLAAGVVAAIGLTRLVERMLFGVTPLDALTYAGVAALMLVTAAAACYLPARRATAVPPVSALREM